MPKLLLIVAQLLLVNGAGDEVPESLSRAMVRRIEFKTAYFKYELETNIPNVRRTSKHHYEARFAGVENVYWTDFGDEDGIVIRHGLAAQPLFGVRYACSPLHIVRCNGGKDEWGIHDGESVLHARPKAAYPADLRAPAPNMFLDPRSAGLWPRAYCEKSPGQWLEDFQGRGLKWLERRHGEFIEVSAFTKQRDDSASTVETVNWRINPAQDYSIVEIERLTRQPDGTQKLIERMKASHRLVDGRWWPERCETTFAMGGNEVFSFSAIEFGRKEHPKELRPDTLGIPPGIDAVDRLNHVAGSPLRVGKYLGGGTVVSKAEWHAHFKDQFDSGELVAYIEKAKAFGPGEYPRWWSAGEDNFGLEQVARAPDLWEAYVRRWIIQHTYTDVSAGGAGNSNSLTESQIEAAWGILKDCRKRAAPIVQRLRQEAKEDLPEKKGTTKQVSQAEGTAKSNGSDGKSTGESTTTKPSRNGRSLEQIFETLKARLNGLLTTKQEKIDGRIEPHAGGRR